MTSDTADPHAGQPVLQLGIAPKNARVTAILVHGRGASAEDMMGLAGELDTRDVSYIAPQAGGNSWYPLSFLSPLDQNEPHLSSALGLLRRLISGLEADGITRDRIALLGFSQGACLSLEFAARNAGRYRGIVALSGGLIGPPGAARDYPGSMLETPVFLGCSDVDPHIPVNRVRESSEVFRKLGAKVDERIYPGMGHAVNRDELLAVRALLT